MRKSTLNEHQWLKLHQLMLVFLKKNVTFAYQVKQGTVSVLPDLKAAVAWNCSQRIETVDNVIMI